MNPKTYVAISIAILSVAGCDDASGPSTVRLKGNFTVAKARALKGFDVYYAGGKVGGLPLTSVNRVPVTAPPGTPVARRLQHARGRIDSIEFNYGSCTTPPAGEGCNLPLTIQVWPACARYFGLYQGFGSPLPHRRRIRDAPAAYFERGYRLEIQTGASTVVLFGSRSRIMQAVGALEGLNVEVRPTDPLPPPVAGALVGKLAC